MEVVVVEEYAREDAEMDYVRSLCDSHRVNRGDRAPRPLHWYYRAWEAHAERERSVHAVDGGVHKVAE